MLMTQVYSLVQLSVNLNQTKLYIYINHTYGSWLTTLYNINQTKLYIYIYI